VNSSQTKPYAPDNRLAMCIPLEQLFMFGSKANEELKVIQNHLRILRYEEVEAECDWGGPANKMIIRMIAGKER
jgi:hypothetical protein